MLDPYARAATASLRIDMQARLFEVLHTQQGMQYDLASACALDMVRGMPLRRLLAISTALDYGAFDDVGSVPDVNLVQAICDSVMATIEA